MAEHVGIHAAPGVRHRQFHIVSERQGGVGGASGAQARPVKFQWPGGRRWAWRLWHSRPDSWDLLQLSGSAFTCPLGGIGTDDQLDVLSDEAPEHAFDVADDRVQRQYVRFHRLLPAEGHQLANQVRRPFASLCISSILARMGLPTDSSSSSTWLCPMMTVSRLLKSWASPGQAADGFHLLRLSKLLFAHP